MPVELAWASPSQNGSRSVTTPAWRLKALWAKAPHSGSGSPSRNSGPRPTRLLGAFFELRERIPTELGRTVTVRWPAPFFETVPNFDTYRSLQMTFFCAHAGTA